MTKDDEELNMGPWNIHKYNVKKKNGSAGKGNHEKHGSNNQKEITLRENTKIQGSYSEIPKETPIWLEKQNPKETELPLAADTVDNTRRWSKAKVRNSSGGKNPQIHTKGRGITKPGKGITRKDMGVVKVSNVKGKKVAKPFPYRAVDVDKENIPSTYSSQNTLGDKEKQEEEMLEYMRIMYKSHGENLLKRSKKWKFYQNCSRTAR